MKINPYTGEVIPEEEAVAAFISEEEERDLIPARQMNIPEVWQGALPEHIRQLESLDLPIEEKEAVLSLYEGGTKIPFKAKINTEVTILGAIFWFHPPFKGKDGQMHEGFYKIRFLIQERDEQGLPKILEASAGALSLHVLALLKMKGWYLWDNPVKYRIKQDASSGAFCLVNAERYLQEMFGKEISHRG